MDMDEDDWQTAFQNSPLVTSSSSVSAAGSSASSPKSPTVVYQIHSTSPSFLLKHPMDVMIDETCTASREELIDLLKRMTKARDERVPPHVLKNDGCIVCWVDCSKDVQLMCGYCKRWRLCRTCYPALQGNCVQCVPDGLEHIAKARMATRLSSAAAASASSASSPSASSSAQIQIPQLN